MWNRSGRDATYRILASCHLAPSILWLRAKQMKEHSLFINIHVDAVSKESKCRENNVFSPPLSYQQNQWSIREAICFFLSRFTPSPPIYKRVLVYTSLQQGRQEGDQGLLRDICEEDLATSEWRTVAATTIAEEGMEKEIMDMWGFLFTVRL